MLQHQLTRKVIQVDGSSTDRHPDRTLASVTGVGEAAEGQRMVSALRHSKLHRCGPNQVTQDAFAVAHVRDAPFGPRRR